jgi:hypothetical protein
MPTYQASSILTSKGLYFEIDLRFNVISTKYIGTPYRRDQLCETRRLPLILMSISTRERSGSPRSWQEIPAEAVQIPLPPSCACSCCADDDRMDRTISELIHRDCARFFSFFRVRARKGERRGDTQKGRWQSCVESCKLRDSYCSWWLGGHGLLG